MRGVFPTVVAIVFSLSLSAAAAPLDEDAAPFPAPPDPSEFQGKGPPTQKGPPTLSPEERAKSAKALVDRNGNGLSDGLEDRLATLGANEPVDVIVTFSGPGNAASAQAAVGRFAVNAEYHLIPGFAATMSAAQARALAAAPGVFRVEEDVTVRAFLKSGRPDFGVDDVVAIFGLDPFSGGLTGYNIKVCFVDTGIQDTHEAFNYHDPVTGAITGTRIMAFEDFAGDINGIKHAIPYDDAGHGTHTSGTLGHDGGAGPTASGGDPVNAPKARGVAPDAWILMAKVLDYSGQGMNSWVISGIQWCVDQDADVLSISLGVPGSSRCKDALCKSVENAVSAGVTTVVAAGNEGDLSYTIGSPAAAPTAITVGAAADFSALIGEPWMTSGIYTALFSSVGPDAAGRLKPDVMGPGLSVLSAYIDPFSIYGCGIGCYAIADGTSMATPYVAGVAALMKQADPSLTPAQIKQIITDTAHDRLTPGQDNVSGHGLIDALSAVEQAMNLPDTTYPPNDLPYYDVAADSVPDNGQTDILITVDNPYLPLAVTVTIEGDASCESHPLFGTSCYTDPDLDAYLYASDSSGTIGAQVYSSACPAGWLGGGSITNECGIAGQRETLFLHPNASNPLLSHYVLRVFAWAGDPNFGAGGPFTYEISNGSVGGIPGNSAPQVTITSPTNGATFTPGTSVLFEGTATDIQDGDLTGSLAWSSDIDGAIGTGGSFSAAPSYGNHTVTAEVTDLDLEPGSETVDITVNTPPAVTITSPADGGPAFASGASINFAATATDPEEDDLTLTAGLSWTSDLDGPFGPGGGNFSTTLSDGIHNITAAVTDSLGSPDSDSITITVGAPPSVATEMSIDSLAYSMNGGKNNDRHLFIDIIVLDDLSGPVAGATVSINLFLGVPLYGSAVGSTDENGRVGFSRKNADPGCYTTDVTNLTSDGLAWVGGTPANQICK